MQIIESSLNIGRWVCVFFFPPCLFAIHSPFLCSIDLSRKDNRHIDSQAQQFVWFTPQLRLILRRPQSTRGFVLTGDWLVGLWHCRCKSVAEMLRQRFPCAHVISWLWGSLKLGVNWTSYKWTSQRSLSLGSAQSVWYRDRLNCGIGTWC